MHADETRPHESRELLAAMLRRRLPARAAAWLEASSDEIRGGVTSLRFASLLSLASREARRHALEPDAREADAAWQSLPGWRLEGWSVLDAARVCLVLAHPGLASSAFEGMLEECFRFADEGELCALYRSLAHLPGGHRFARRAAEGCRTNMRSVFEAVACDTPYPARCLDDLAWRQLVIKALFLGVPLARVHGAAERLSPELARMALDLADERRSAGREVPPDLWLCLGPFAGPRGIASLERELSSSNAPGRRTAALALARLRASDPREPGETG
jgi:hypothetical protein